MRYDLHFTCFSRYDLHLSHDFNSCETWSDLFAFVWNIRHDFNYCVCDKILLVTQMHFAFVWDIIYDFNSCVVWRDFCEICFAFVWDMIYFCERHDQNSIRYDLHFTCFNRYDLHLSHYFNSCELWSDLFTFVRDNKHDFNSCVWHDFISYTNAFCICVRHQTWF